MNADFERGFERGFIAGSGMQKAEPLHPLHTQEWINAMLDQGMQYVEIRHRRTGKSTAQALRGLAWVINNPGEVLQIVDHYPSRMANNNNLMYMMREMADKLGLQHLVFNRADQTVCFGQPNKDYRQ